MNIILLCMYNIDNKASLFSLLLDCKRTYRFIVNQSPLKRLFLRLFVERTSILVLSRNSSL